MHNSETQHINATMAQTTYIYILADICLHKKHS